MSVNYILTFDYELFGSGKGSVKKHLVDPTNKILKNLDKSGTKVTFFVEQLEVAALINLKNEYPQYSREYIDAELLEQQLFNIVDQGHDIQLHLHPQWYGAKYVNGVWQLNFAWWRFSALPYRASKEGVPGKYELIKEGKEWLEGLIRKIKPDYQCVAFRAGGYNVGADKSSVDALLNNDIELDSSVCPGYFSNSSLSKYDYTAVDHTLTFWRASESLLLKSSNENKASCLQLPLITVRSTLIEKLSLARIYATLVNRQYKSVNFTGEVTNLTAANTEALKNTNFDVCLSSGLQIRKLIKAVHTNKTNDVIAPVTLIGHPKDFSYFSPLTRICNLLGNNSFCTVAEFIKRLKHV
jgi:hypothetical protein